jgi:hypothetical protein
MIPLPSTENTDFAQVLSVFRMSQKNSRLRSWNLVHPEDYEEMRILLDTFQAFGQLTFQHNLRQDFSLAIPEVYQSGLCFNATNWP